jgi:hypothetical protein
LALMRTSTKPLLRIPLLLISLLLNPSIIKLPKDACWRQLNMIPFCNSRSRANAGLQCVIALTDGTYLVGTIHAYTEQTVTLPDDQTELESWCIRVFVRGCKHCGDRSFRGDEVAFSLCSKRSFLQHHYFTMLR